MYTDMSDIRGPLAEVVPHIERHVANHRNTLFIGHPGSGAVMLARRIPGIMPTMSEVQRNEVQYAFDNARMNRTITDRVFRAPHHTCSTAAMIGGMRPLSLGEVHFARHGAILLDELPEFRRTTIAASAIELDRMGDARPLVVGTSCPCPCGWNGYSWRICKCSKRSIDIYQARLRSYAALFHMLAIRLPETVPLAKTLLDNGEPPADASAVIRERLTAAWAA